MDDNLLPKTAQQVLKEPSATLPLDMSEDELAFSAALFAALGNPTRLRIAELLTRGECTVNEVAQTLRIHQPNASLNLTTLSRAGIAKVTRKGVQRYYSLRGPRIAQILLLANQFRGVHAVAITSDARLRGDEPFSSDAGREQNADDAEQNGGGGGSGGGAA